jgi:hypothetical protein
MDALLIALAAAATCAAPSSHELDFWLGSWEVREANEVVATSTIELVSGGCAVRETYTQKDGYNGTSLSFHDPVLGKWRQTWIDTRGAVGEFSGAFSNGAMRFEGETHTAEGKRVLRKMTLARELNGIRQTSLRSDDGGLTWKPHYEIFYTPVAR